jgi:hypothetical protein
MTQLLYALQHLARPLQNGRCRFGEIANLGVVAIDHKTPVSRQSLEPLRRLLWEIPYSDSYRPLVVPILLARFWAEFLPFGKAGASRLVDAFTHTAAFPYWRFV